MATLSLSAFPGHTIQLSLSRWDMRAQNEKRGPAKGQGQGWPNHPHQNLFSDVVPQSPQGLGNALANGAQGMAGKLILQIPLTRSICLSFSLSVGSVAVLIT